MRHQIVFQIWYDGQWNDVPTYNRGEITITDGRQDQLSRVSPTTLSGLLINNRSGHYSPRNALSPLFGKIGRNTRCRLLCDGIVEFVGEVEAWPSRWSRGGHDAWVPITAHGVLYRLGLPGQKARARSSLRRFYDRATPQPVAYWPLDGAANLVSGGSAMALKAVDSGGVVGLDWKTVELAPWLGAGVELAELTLIEPPVGVIETQIATIDVTLRAAPATTAASSWGLLVTTSGGSTVGLIFASWVAGVPSVSLFGGGGPAVATATAADAIKAFDDGVHHWRFVLEQNGSDVDLTVYVDGVVVMSGTDTSAELSTVRPVLFTNSGVAVVAGCLVQFGGAAPSVTDAAAAALGHAGEQAHERIARVCTEENIPVTILGSTSVPVGPQPIDSVLEVCLDAAAVDHGILFEPQDVFGLAYRCHSDLFNQDPRLSLTYGQREIGGSLDPSEDLDFVQNDVTVTNVNTGESARSVQETGPLNVQEPVDDPDGVGRLTVDYRLNLPL
jgi:hypothetical protein